MINQTDEESNLSQDIRYVESKTEMYTKLKYGEKNFS